MSEPIEMTEQDEADIITLLEKPEPEYNTVLKVWREVLRPAEEQAKLPVTPQWATRMVSLFPQMRMQDMDHYRNLYFGYLAELNKILVEEIEIDPDCLKPDTPETDVEENSQHYKNLILDWQKAILGWELGWRCTDKDAHVHVAAISEVHKMFFGEQGITGYLDTIGFQFTDDDAAEITVELEALREAAL